MSTIQCDGRTSNEAMLNITPNANCQNEKISEFYRNFMEVKYSFSGRNEHVLHHIKELTYGLELISSGLQNKIRHQYYALLTQASHSNELNKIMDTVKLYADGIRGTACEISLRIAGANKKLELLTRKLNNLNTTYRYLQQLNLYLRLFQVLRSSAAREQQAQILAKIDECHCDINLSDLDLVKQQYVTITDIKQNILSEAGADLQEALRSCDLEQIQSTLQIFSYSNSLKFGLNTLFSRLFADVEQMISSALDTESISIKYTTEQPQTFSSNDYEAKLWVKVDKLFCELLYNTCKQVKLLEKIMMNENLLSDGEELFTIFWEKLCILLKNGFENASSYTWHNLEVGLPRLLGAMSTLEGSLKKEYIFNPDLFEPFELGYFNRCQNNLNACFQNVVIPNCDLVDTLIRTCTNELSVAIVNKNLSSQIVTLINNANAHFWYLIDGAIKKIPESEQIVDLPNAFQLTNISLANVTYYHNEQMKIMVNNLGPNLSDEEVHNFLLDLSKGNNLITSIVKPLKESINDCIRAILISLHHDPSLNNTANSNGPSLYMKELQYFTARVKKTHLNPYNDNKMIEKCCNELATRCIEQFIFNVSCVRPLTKMGRSKLSSDCKYLEIALKPFVSNLAQLGYAYKSLRALCVLLDLSPEKVTIDGILRPSTVLMLLFSHAGPELASPHVSLNWNIEKLSLWWESHTSEEDRLELISGALQKYETAVRLKKNVYYDPVYTIITVYLKNRNK